MSPSVAMDPFGSVHQILTQAGLTVQARERNSTTMQAIAEGVKVTVTAPEPGEFKGNVGSGVAISLIPQGAGEARVVGNLAEWVAGMTDGRTILPRLYDTVSSAASDLATHLRQILELRNGRNLEQLRQIQRLGAASLPRDNEVA